MPDFARYGRFVVIGSSCEWKLAPNRRGKKYMALIEMEDPEAPTPWKIDPRLKNIKRIILVSEKYCTWKSRKNIGWKMWKREWERYCVMAEKFEKLYPIHIMAKEWPLALPVYSE